MDRKPKTMVQIRLAPGYAEKLKTIAAQMGRRTYGEVIQSWIDRHTREHGWRDAKKVDDGGK